MSNNIQELIETANKFCRSIDIYIMEDEKFCETIKKELDSCIESATKIRDNLTKIKNQSMVNEEDLNWYYSDWDFSEWVDRRIYMLWEDDQEDVVEHNICSAIERFKREGIWNSLFNTYFIQAVADYVEWKDEEDKKNGVGEYADQGSLAYQYGLTSCKYGW